ncbi:MAG: PaaI family thioesterase [Desulfuromonadales bacterium]|uniref:PaaI family thioesterase n=1 Tax=Desulfuromonas sp. KJ2020 TaxID=2919173 RepID=UPI0020A82F58|nr:PaaI family thioesterase [Desulfuromonas sp. KJ2020]MCP3178069.1 PaaI family thioesterase [Desulfuromonas sp. KJ2020]
MNVPSATIESINAIPLLKTLGIVAEEIGERHAVMRVTVDERHLNYYGGAHGGLIATLVDTVCFFPAPLLPAGLAVTTSNLNVNYLRAVQPGETLVARSEIVHLGRRTVSLRVAVHSEQRLIAQGMATLIVLTQSAD